MNLADGLLQPGARRGPPEDVVFTRNLVGVN